MDRIKNISPWQFAGFRIVFGVYLVVHFAGLLPYAGELFSGEGLLGNARLNFTFGVLPNPLEQPRERAAVTDWKRQAKRLT